MGFYIGIDLGTTNSAIATFDGTDTKVLRDPENNEVTPSAIYIDSRSKRFYGRKAYNAVLRNEGDVALAFKRYIGTNKIYHFESSGVNLSAIECSTEILKVLRGYLQQVETKEKNEIAAVITVPAAFNQVQKEATNEAAHAAGFRNVALIQEPVASIMSVMQTVNVDGHFLIYDLGGGTFDISIAENNSGEVNLLYQGGKPVCGGKDWDRIIFDKVIKPWVSDKFKLPDDFTADNNFKCLHTIGLFAAEKAKISLSTQESAAIYMDENEIDCKDLNGKNIYFDVPFTRAKLDELVESMIEETIEFTKSMLTDVGLSSTDIEKLVFIGGPTSYKPLREKVSAALEIQADTTVNPMTAVAVGASIFAESIDWGCDKRDRKPATAVMRVGKAVRFKYDTRTADVEARLVFKTEERGVYTAEVRSADTGWTSGYIPLEEKQTKITLPLGIKGINKFNVLFQDNDGGSSKLGEHVIKIYRTFGNMKTVAASHSIMLEVLDKVNGEPTAVYLVKKGDPLPMKDKLSLSTGIELDAGSYEDLRFNIRSGEIKKIVRENEYIGTYKICGTDFDGEDIGIGTEIICDYEITDSGNLRLSASVPDIRADFGRKNYYCYQDAIIDLGNESDKIVSRARILLEKINDLPKEITDKRLVEARQKIFDASMIEGVPDDNDKQDKLLHARSSLFEAGALYARVLESNQRIVRQAKLDGDVQVFEVKARKYASADEIEQYEGMVKLAQKAIDNDESGFDNRLKELSNFRFNILWKQDWYAIELFNLFVLTPLIYTDKIAFAELKQNGLELVRKDKIDELRFLIIKLNGIRIEEVSNDDLVGSVNVVRR
jgi:molecular chaperone DnaK